MTAGRLTARAGWPPGPARPGPRLWPEPPKRQSCSPPTRLRRLPTFRPFLRPASGQAIRGPSTSARGCAAAVVEFPSAQIPTSAPCSSTRRRQSAETCGAVSWGRRRRQPASRRSSSSTAPARERPGAGTCGAVAPPTPEPGGPLPMHVELQRQCPHRQLLASRVLPDLLEQLHLRPRRHGQHGRARHPAGGGPSPARGPPGGWRQIT